MSIQASAMALIIATLPLYSTFKPADHEQVAESPTVIKPEEAPKPKPKPQKQAESTQTIEVVATHYTATCEGCIGITKNGTDVRNTIYSGGKRIIAVDPSVIPLNSTVQVTYADGMTFKAIAADVGGAIKGGRIDVLVASESEAYRLGRKKASVEILKRGGR